MQQRKSQSKWDHARRIEGHRRASIYKQMKKEVEDEKVRQVYREYAELHRQRQEQQQPPQLEASDSEGDASAPAAPT